MAPARLRSNPLGVAGTSSIRRNSAPAARAGLPEADMEGWLHAALYGQVAATLPEEDRITNIRVRYPDRIRYDPAQLSRLPIAVPPGTLSAARTSSR
jgi:Cu/Ag efflux pump CusA